MNARSRLPSILATSLLWLAISCAGTPPLPTGEPAPASAMTEEAAPARPESALGRLLEEMGVEYRPEDESIEMEGWVNMRDGLVEVFACTPQGKEHESVVVLDCVPSGVHAGLLALGLEPGSPVRFDEQAYEPPTGDGVRIDVVWTDAEGRERRARAEDWVWNLAEDRPMEPTSWVFAGSYKEVAPGSNGKAQYAADRVRSLITTYHDPTSVLDNPLPPGSDDTVYYANPEAVPEPGTPVRVILRRPAP